MSISSRIWEMNNHLLADYEVLTLAGADLTGVNKNILNLKQSWQERLLYFMREGTQVVWNNWNKVTGSGTTLSLNNTEEAPMSLTYKGNTSQNGTPTPSSPIPVQVVSGDNSIEVVGKNLFHDTLRQGVTSYNTNVYNGGSDVINVRLTSSADGWTILKAGTYTINAITSQNKTLQVSSITFDTSGNFYNISNVSGQWQNLPFTFTTPVDLKYKVNFKYSDASIISTTEISNIQIEKNNQATTYEPYKGASYPINLGNKELCKIGTYQDKIDKSSGKNLTNLQLLFGNTTCYSINSNNEVSLISPDTRGDSSIDGTTWGQYLEAGTYTITYNPNSHGNLQVYMKNIGDVTSGTTLASGYKTFTLSQSGIIIVKFTGLSNYLPYNAGHIQIEKGSQATPYEPYGTGWYLKKEIGKVVLNGSENWNLGSMFYTNKLSNSPGIGASQIYSNYFKWTVGASDDNSIAVPGTAGSSNNYIWLKASQFETTSDLTTWLGTHNTIVYYPLATPTYDKITDSTLISQLEAMKQSYDSQTNISQTNNDLPFELNITALSNE